MVAALARLAERAAEHATLVMAGRSHNVPAQATTMGKRFANAGEELLQALRRVEELLARYPLRGHEGSGRAPSRTCSTCSGSADQVAELEAAVARHLGFEATLTNVGQVYPRSLDLDVVAALVQAGSGPASLATTIRLMAGLELATEGFQPGQVGSSAMPHKMNSRSCERINGLLVVLRGHLSMVGELAGDQWNEGDVSCSVVRRVALPDAFLAADGLFETFLTVLEDFGVYPAVVQRELERYLPFLTTTKVLMGAVRAGVGREVAHEAIKEHAVAVALAMRERARRRTTSSIAWPPTSGSRSIAPRSTRRSASRCRSSAPPRHRCRPSSTRWPRSSPVTRTRRPTAPSRSCSPHGRSGGTCGRPSTPSPAPPPQLFAAGRVLLAGGRRRRRDDGARAQPHLAATRPPTPRASTLERTSSSTLLALDRGVPPARHVVRARAARPRQRPVPSPGRRARSTGWSATCTPRRFIEVGCGWSTTVTRRAIADGALDTALTCIEPLPARRSSVRSRASSSATRRSSTRRSAVFDALGRGDVLFIDSSHVAKTGSDVVHLVLHVLPRLAAGVVVHVHDIFLPEDYPIGWVESGFGWNEQYVVHAFLLGHARARVLAMNHWLSVRHPEAVAAAFGDVPLHGSSLWFTV